MIGLITKGISKVFGSKSERDIKLVMPYVEKIKEIYPALRDISDEDLRAKTGELRNRIADKLAGIDNNIQEIHTKIDTDESLAIHEKEDLFSQIDKLEEDRNDVLEDFLLEILPEAFLEEFSGRWFLQNKLLHRHLAPNPLFQ